MIETKRRCCDCAHWQQVGAKGKCGAPLPQSVTDHTRIDVAWNDGAKCQLWQHDGVPIGNPDY